MDGSVTDTKHPRVDQPSDADAHSADKRPPHPVNLQMGEEVLETVHHLGQHAGSESCQQAHRAGETQSCNTQRSVGRDGKYRSGA